MRDMSDTAEKVSSATPIPYLHLLSHHTEIEAVEILIHKTKPLKMIY